MGKKYSNNPYQHTATLPFYSSRKEECDARVRMEYGVAKDAGSTSVLHCSHPCSVCPELRLVYSRAASMCMILRYRLTTDKRNHDVTKCHIQFHDHGTVPGALLSTALTLLRHSGQALHEFQVHFVAHAPCRNFAWAEHQRAHSEPVTTNSVLRLP